LQRSWLLRAHLQLYEKHELLREHLRLHRLQRQPTTTAMKYLQTT
jgi:hypothetical protein